MKFARCTRLIQSVVLFALLTSVWVASTSNASAQTVPGNCFPNAGAVRDCASTIPSPYRFYGATCGIDGRQSTQSAAWGVFIRDYQHHCVVSVTPRPWLSPGGSATYSMPCVGQITGTYGDYYGQEWSNVLVADVVGSNNSLTCAPPQTNAKGAVTRLRDFACPEGYLPYTADVCSRTFAGPDHAKNYGDGCQKDGGCVTKHPINIGVGNKFRAETDYAAAGSPLRFVRYYNSLPYNSGLEGHFRSSSFESSGGISGYAQIANEPSEQGTHYRTLNLGVVGVGWRHRYQRNVIKRTGSLMIGAHVFAANGRVVSAVKTNGVWSMPSDIGQVLSETLDGAGNQDGWRMDLEDGSSEFFDAAGHLTKIRQRSGIEENVTYDSQCDRVVSVTDTFGNTLTFAYTKACLSGEHRIATVTVPGGGVYSYGYDTDGRLITVTAPGGAVKTYHYENVALPVALTGITDESGQRHATFSYDARGRASVSELSGGAERTSVVYAPTNNFTVTSADVTNALGVTAHYDFAIKQGVAKVSAQNIYCEGCPGNTKSLTYDNNGNPTRKRDFLNQSTCLAYDSTRNLETVRVEGFAAAIASCPANLASYTPTVGTRQRKITTAWHATFRLPTSIAESNRLTSFTHDASGNVLTRTVTDTSVTPNVSRTWTYTYNSFGRVLTEDGPRTDVSDLTTYTYYTCTTGFRCGQLNTITNALGHVTTYNAYNAHGQPTQITDANGLITGLAYDSRQRLTDRCTGATLPGCAGGELTHLDYWPTGLRKKVTNPDASYIEYTYDAAHRLTQINDGALNKIVYTLDLAGNRTAENTYDPSNALRRTHTRVFNTLNQLWKDVNAAGTAAVTTVFGYDNNGNPTTTNAPLSRNSASLYDELNRLKQITDPASGITLFGYDANDNLTSVTDPRSLVTSYTYSGFGDLKTQTSPDTGLTTNTYDTGGNLDTSTDSRGAVTDYGYDAANRVTSASFTKSGVTDQTLTYVYDTGANQLGHLTAASDANHSLAWSYDTQGRITGKGQTTGGVTLSVGYGYNASGQLASTVLPSGATIAFGYNTNGQVTSLTLNGSTTILSAITYDPFGPITSWTWGNGTAANRGFDTDGKITQVDNANGASLKNYAYDDAFRITGIADAGNSALSWTYGYDSLDRLNSATKTGTSRGWTYDANGNRLTETGTTPSTYTNAGTSNRVSSITGSLPRTYAYDTAGNTLSHAGATFTYNHRGRMATASNGGVTATYTYNALGQRIKRTAASVTTLYAYDEAGHLAGEYTAAGALIQETVWLGDTPVATLRPNGSGGVILYYVHADHLNTPRLVTDSSNNIRWRWDSDPFGTTVPNENPASLGVFGYNLRFPGQQYDAVVGLHYNYFRDYDPAIGRYVESDPIGLHGGINTYAYALDNPVKYGDPRGLVVQRCCRKAQVAFGLVSHCYLKTDTKTAGMNAGPRCSLAGDNGSDMPWITKTYVSDHSCETGGSCTTMPDVDESCVNKELEIGRYLGRFGVTNNCQSFAIQTLSKCRKRKETPWTEDRLLDYQGY